MKNKKSNFKNNVVEIHHRYPFKKIVKDFFNEFMSPLIIEAISIPSDANPIYSESVIHL